MCRKSIGMLWGGQAASGLGDGRKLDKGARLLVGLLLLYHKHKQQLVWG